MSKYVDEIIADIKSYPGSWSRYGYDGLFKNGVRVANCGNGSKYWFFWLGSVVEVTINNALCSGLTWPDRYRLEEVFLWWMRNATIEQLSGKRWHNP
jgi:hypothetical protein